MGFLGGGANGLMIPGGGSTGAGGNGGFNGTSFIGDEGGVNLSGLPFVGGLFPNAAQRMQRELQTQAANTMGAMRPGIAEGFQNIWGGVQQAYNPAQQALMSIYGGGRPGGGGGPPTMTPMKSAFTQGPPTQGPPAAPDPWTAGAGLPAGFRPTSATGFLGSMPIVGGMMGGMGGLMPGGGGPMGGLGGMMPGGGGFPGLGGGGMPGMGGGLSGGLGGGGSPIGGLGGLLKGFV